MNCPREVATLFKLRLGLRIEVFVIGSDSYVNLLTGSQSKQGDDFELTVLEVTTHRTSTRGWINMLSGGPESDNYRCPLCCLLQEKVENAPSRGFQVPRASDVDRRA